MDTFLMFLLVGALAQAIDRTALAGGGITFGIEETFRPWIERGDLVPLLQDFLPPFPGFFLYFPSRHHPPAKLRALIEHVRAFRDAGVPA